MGSLLRFGGVAPTTEEILFEGDGRIWSMDCPGTDSGGDAGGGLNNRRYEGGIFTAAVLNNYWNVDHRITNQVGAPITHIPYNYFDKNVGYQIYIALPSVTQVEVYIQWGAMSPLSIAKHFGIWIHDNALFACSGDGAAFSTTDLATALAINTWYRIRSKCTATAIQTWVDGIAKADKATNIPIGAPAGDAYWGFRVQTTDANKKELHYLAPMHWYCEW